MLNLSNNLTTPSHDPTCILGMDQIERNILVGSLLGDGSLALYGRSKNAHYREHGGDAQIEYRKRKAYMLRNLEFKFCHKGKYGKISSPSRELFTKLYHLFYTDKIKIITNENIQLLDHPIGLAYLYMDDGSLVINPSHKKKSIHLSPQITISSLCFSKAENIILQKYLNHTFSLNFMLKNSPYGQKYMLGINKQNDILEFLNCVRPFIEPIPCMHYKIDLENRLDAKQLEFQARFPSKSVNLPSLDVVDNSYSSEDELVIITMKKAGIKDLDIAKSLGRSYWGTVDKIRRLRAENRL